MMAKTLIEKLSPDEINRSYPNIWDSRISIIENASREFRDNYLCNGHIGWEIAAKNEGIFYIEDSRVVVPCTYTNRRIVLVPPYKWVYLRKLSEAFRAHEFGHVIMDHGRVNLSILEEEDEAEYFAYNIMGTNIKEELSTFSGTSSIFLNIILSPLKIYMHFLNSNKYRCNIISDHQERISQKK